MKIVVNHCFGGFGLSDEAVERLGLKSRYDDIDRTDSRLVALVEEDAEKASGDFAELGVVEISDEATDWTIDEYDGIETVIYVVDGKLCYA